MSRTDAAPPPPAGHLPPELAQLLATARSELDRHVNQDGTCRDCGLSWPCAPARLAAFTLDSL
ncbi:MAG TPA: hypothetical protein VGS62_05370 [Streptosporangiaceae bacterium]|nr:hypothetical protein [Streptosporangiaceae bacterium]